MVRFANGQIVNHVEQATYLGKLITGKIDEKREAGHRLGEVWGMVRRTEYMWKKANISTIWKIKIMQTMILPKLIYAWNTIRTTSTMDDKIDSVQARLLRRILQRPPTWIDRAFSHSALIAEANEKLKEAKKAETIIPWSQVLRHRRIRYLGHVLRSGANSLIYNCFLDQHGDLRQLDKWRVGRPRTHWAEQVIQEAWEATGCEDPFDWTTEQMAILHSAAEARVAPFEAPD